MGKVFKSAKKIVKKAQQKGLKIEHKKVSVEFD